MILGRKAKTLNSMNNLGFKYMNNYGSWALGSRWNVQLDVVDDINDSRSHDLGALDVMNSLELRLIWRILHYELKPLDAMNNLGSWMT